MLYFKLSVYSMMHRHFTFHSVDFVYLATTIGFHIFLL